MNAYFQHILYYKSEKRLKTLTTMIVRYNIIIPFLKTGQKFSLVIIDGCLAPERHTDVSIYGFKEISSKTKVY